MIIRERPPLIKLFFVMQGSVVPQIVPHIVFVILFSGAIIAADYGGITMPHISLEPLSVFGVALSLFLGFRNNAAGVAAETLRELSDLGIKLALDDFGTGYSSLSQLQQHPFDVLKIDKSFVQIANAVDKTFLKAINSFAQTLGIQTVAEGVETQEQNLWCHSLDFDRLQGFYFSKPISVQEFESLLIESDQELPQKMHGG